MTRKIFIRYKASTLCMYIGLIVAFLTLYYGNKSIIRMNNSIIEKNGNRYVYEIEGVYIGDIFPYEELDSGGNGNCFVKGLYLMIDDMGVSLGVDVALYMNEDCYLPLENGRWPDSEEIEGDEKIALIGRDYKAFTFEQNQDTYIRLQGEAYRVIGYIGGRSDEYDGQIVLFSQNLGEMARQQLILSGEIMGISIIFQSNFNNMDEEIKYFDGVLNKEASFSVTDNQYNDNYIVAQKNDIYFWIYLYCAFICILVSVYWIMERRNEIIIRKAYGYSDLRLIGFIAFQIVKLLTAAIITAIFIALIINLVYNANMNYAIDEAKTFTLTIAIFVISGIMITMICPMISVLRKFSGEGINKKEI